MRRGFGRFFIALLLLGVLAPAQVPQSALSSLTKAMELASKGQFGQAEKILLDLEKTYPGEPEIQYHLGLILLRQRKLAAASNRLEAAAKLSPKSAVVWLAVAQTRLGTGNRSGAIQAAEKAGSLGQSEPAVWRALAMFYSQAEDFAKAAEYEVRWSQAMPGDKGSLFRAIEYYLMAGKADEVIALSARVPAGGENAVLQNLVGKAYRIKRNPAAAVEHLQRAVRLGPDEPRYYLDLAQLFLDHNTPEPAQMIMESADRRFPKNVDVLRSLGLSYYAAGQKEKALDIFLEVVDLDPDSEVSYASLEALLPDAGERLGVLVELLRSFSTRRPSSPLGHYLLATALSLESGETKETEGLLRKAISAAPNFWPAYFELHKHLKLEGKLEDAAKLLEKAIELNPDSAPAHYNLAQIYAQLGNNERAIEERKIHHELMVRQREETEQRQKEAPKLRYELVTQ